MCGLHGGDLNCVDERVRYSPLCMNCVDRRASVSSEYLFGSISFTHRLSNTPSSTSRATCYLLRDRSPFASQPRRNPKMNLGTIYTLREIHVTASSRPNPRVPSHVFHRR